MKRATSLALSVIIAVLAGSAVAGDASLACNRGALSRRELRRGETMLAQLRGAVIERRELADGWSYRLRAEGDTLARLTEWMQLERRCCPFFDFALEWKGAEPDPWLTIRGREGVKEILEDAWKAPAPR